MAQDPAERGVFVNYRRTDTGWVANVVADALRRRLGPSAEVFLDNRSIGLGGVVRPRAGGGVAAGP